MERVKCPYCDSYFIINKDNYKNGYSIHEKNGKYNALKVYHEIVWCTNPECGELILIVQLKEGELAYSRFTSKKTLHDWTLLPENRYMNLPDFIPSIVQEDYKEACLIADLSPKASATLLRRCLQSMIRDFWGINEKNLFLEIEKLQGKIDSDLFSAIHSMRAIANIGAHPEKDISTIIEIESEETKELIGLIEILFKEWYFEREEKKKRLEKIKTISQSKTQKGEII